MNKWIISGNLGHPPRLRTTQSQTPVLNMSVALNERLYKDGGYTEETTWVDVVLFGKRGEALSKVLAQGDRVECVGRARVRTYEARDGTTQARMELIADDVELVPGSGKRRARSGDEDVPSTSRPMPAPEASAPQNGLARHRDQLRPAASSSPPPWMDETDDLPF